MKLELNVKLQNVETARDLVESYRGHFGFILECTHKSINEDNPSEYAIRRNLKELEAVIRTGFFMNIIPTEDYRVHMDEIMRFEIRYLGGLK